MLGILVVNIQSFAFVSAARLNPTVQGNLEGANWWVWLVTFVLFDGKFISMFAILFGASITLLVGRCARRGVPAAPIHFRRMAILLGMGLLHAHLLWYGDWLAILAVSGAVAFLYEDMPPRRLLAVGVAVYAIGSLTSLVIARWLPGWTSDMAARWAPSPDAVAWEVTRYRSGWLDQAAHRMPAALRYETSYLATRGLWQMTGLMLVGMAFVKLGVVTGNRTPRFYALMAGAGLGAGLPLVLYGVSRSVASGWDVSSYVTVDNHLYYWGAPLMSLGWIATVMLLVSLGVKTGSLADVGRLALTNYLVQTMICTTIFYGHGIGLFGGVERVGQVVIVLGVWAIQLGCSACWLRYFDLGSVEWVWRCLTYGRRLPIRQQARSDLAP